MAMQNVLHAALVALTLAVRHPFATGTRMIPSALTLRIDDHDFQTANFSTVAAMGSLQSTPPRTPQESLIQLPGASSPSPTPPVKPSVSDTWPVCAKDDAGIVVGCHTHCKCGWGHRCYPKWSSPQDVAHTQSNHTPNNSTNVGICEATVTVLALASLVLFTLVLSAFIALRTLLQWRSLEEDAHRGSPVQQENASDGQHDGKRQVHKTSTLSSTTTQGALGKEAVLNRPNDGDARPTPLPGESAETDSERSSDSEESKAADDHADDTDVAKWQALSKAAQHVDALHEAEAAQLEAAEKDSAEAAAERKEPEVKADSVIEEMRF